MTATGIVDHSARIEQSLAKLNLKACHMGEQVHSSEEQVILQLSQLIRYSKVSRDKRMLTRGTYREYIKDFTDLSEQNLLNLED